jgi:hypothetical protein
MSNIERMSPTQRLTYCLVLGLTAHNDEQSQRVGELLDFYAYGLSETQIEGCKSAALQMVEGRMPQRGGAV